MDIKRLVPCWIRGTKLEKRHQVSVRPWLCVISSLILQLAGVLATPLSAKADGREDLARYAQITDIKYIELKPGLNDVIFSARMGQVIGSKTSYCSLGCDIPGVIIQYEERDGIDFNYATYVPAASGIEGNANALSLININYQNVYSYGTFEFPATVHQTFTTAEKSIIFCQAMMNSKPATLMIVADTNQSKEFVNEKKQIEITILEFIVSQIKKDIYYDFNPIFSYTVTKYDDSDVALEREFGIAQVKD